MIFRLQSGELFTSSRTYEERAVCGLFLSFVILWISGICQEIPGMTQLNADDQALLMKLGYFDLWLVGLHICFMVCLCIACM